jgi:hypothetical protein
MKLRAFQDRKESDFEDRIRKGEKDEKDWYCRWFVDVGDGCGPGAKDYRGGCILPVAHLFQVVL